MSVRKALVWAYGGQAFTFLITFAGSIVVARLLTPKDIGIFAFAMATYSIFSIFTNLNVGTFLVRESHISKELVRSVYSVNLFMNISLSLLSFAAGALTMAFTFQREVGLVLIIGSFGPLISCIQFVPTLLYQREMNFGILTRVGMAKTVISTMTVVICAYYGLGALSPAIGPLVGGVFSSAYFAITRSHDNVYRPTLSGLTPIFRFGLQLMSIGGLSALVQRASEIILGSLLGLAALGLYNRASSLASLIFQNVYGSATGVIFTRMSRDLAETGELRETFTKSIRLITAFMWPMVIGLAVLAGPTVHILYGAKWAGAAAPLAYLMVAQFVAFGFGMNWELFVLRHETARLTRFEIVRAVVGLLAFIAGSWFSVTMAAASRVLENLTGYFLNRPHMDRLAGTKKGELERIYGESFLLMVAAVLPAFILMLWTNWAATTSPWLVAGAVLGGIALWLAVLKRQDHPLLSEALILWSKIPGRRPD